MYGYWYMMAEHSAHKAIYFREHLEHEHNLWVHVFISLYKRQEHWIYKQVRFMVYRSCGAEYIMVCWCDAECIMVFRCSWRMAIWVAVPGMCWARGHCSGSDREDMAPPTVKQKVALRTLPLDSACRTLVRFCVLCDAFDLMLLCICLISWGPEFHLQHTNGYTLSHILDVNFQMLL